jgi:hypothetical protein
MREPDDSNRRFFKYFSSANETGLGYSMSPCPGKHLELDILQVSYVMKSR